MAESKSRRRCVTLIYEDRPGCKVMVAGTFNQWRPEKALIDRDHTGVYRCQLRLSPGEYQYKFVVDGQWCLDSSNPNFVPKGIGSLNSLLVVKEK